MIQEKNMHSHDKLVEFLENYPDFILSQGSTDIFVQYSFASNEISPKDFIRNILFEITNTFSQQNH